MNSGYIKTNFHTHSTFCDGKNTLEENVLTAIEKGIKILGFSSHASYPVWVEPNIRPEDYKSYCSQIKQLKEKYSDQIDIRLGFEADYIKNFCRPDFSDYKEFNPDFLIGSVHFLYNGETDITKIMAVDDTPQKLMDSIKSIYNGDVKKLIHHYFESQREMLKDCNFSIIGHPDLIRKFNSKMPFFDESEQWYKDELKETAAAIKKAGVIAELNSGAISRGWLTSPYPSPYFLELLYENNVPVMINSDAHAAENLDCAFDMCLELVKKTGWKELSYPSKGQINHFAI